MKRGGRVIVFVLPTYNEEQNIGSLLNKIDDTMNKHSLDFLILLVNDGSSDRTMGVVESYKGSIQIIDHEINMGLSPTVLDGLKKASEISKPDDIIVTMDADNTHEPSHVKKMIEKIGEGYDVVIASRYEKGGEEVGLAFKRKFLSRSINLMLQILFPIRGVKDYTCGYRAYRASTIKRAFDIYKDDLVEAKSFAAMAEILIKLRRLSVKACEIPLVLRYDQKSGVSKLSFKKTIPDYFRIIIKNIGR